MRTLLNITVALAVTSLFVGCYSCKKSYDPCNGLTYRSKEFGPLLFRKKSKSSDCEACAIESEGEGCTECANGMHMMGEHEVFGPHEGWQTMPSQGPPPAPPAATPDAGPKKTEATAFHYPVRQQTYQAY